MCSHFFRAHVRKSHSLVKQIDFNAALGELIIFWGHGVGRRRKKLVGVKVKSRTALH